MGVGGAVRRRAEVDAGGAAGVAADGRGVDAVAGDRLDEVVAEAVGADPADPLRPVVNAASAQATLDSAPPMPRLKEGTSARLPGCDGRNVTMDSPRQTTSTVAVLAADPGTLGSSWSAVGAGLTIDPASARMLDSHERYTQRLLHRLQR